MSDNKDYTKMTLEELLLEEKKIRKKETFSAGLIGFLIGVALYGIVNGSSGILYIIISAFFIYMTHKSSKKDKINLEQIQAEINTRNSNL